MKPLLGKRVRSKRVISDNGEEVGEILDVTFETNGKLLSLIVRPVPELKNADAYVNGDGLLEVPFESVKAVGRYVVVQL